MKNKTIREIELFNCFMKKNKDNLCYLLAHILIMFENEHFEDGCDCIKIEDMLNEFLNE